MEKTLDKALNKLLEIKTSLEELTPPAIPETLETHDLGGMALEHYNKAKDYLRQGNWAGYGRELENLERLLKEMAKAAEK
jgi:hypothetical protein